MSKIRLYGDVSERHEADFLVIKGAFGCKNNGEVMEKMIDLVKLSACKKILADSKKHA